MFNNRTMVAFFTIAVASSSLIVASDFVGSVFAVMEKVTKYSMVPIISVGQHKSSSSMPQSANPDSDSDWTTADTNAIPAEDLKSLSNCQSAAAADGDLPAAEVMDCYH